MLVGRIGQVRDSAKMLRVRMISGEEVASIPLEEFREEPCDVTLGSRWSLR